MSKPTDSSADPVPELIVTPEDLVADLLQRVASMLDVAAGPDSPADPLVLSQSEIATLESALRDWLDSRPLLMDLDQYKRAESEARKLVQAGRLRDAARVMGWVGPKGTRSRVYDRDDVVRGYVLITTRNALKVRQYFERDHGLTDEEAEKLVPEAPIPPWNALELLAGFHGFPTPQALRKYLQRAKRFIESERAKLEAAGDLSAFDLPDIRIPSEVEPKKVG